MIWVAEKLFSGLVTIDGIDKSYTEVSKMKTWNRLMSLGEGLSKYRKTMLNFNISNCHSILVRIA